jgi:hypothetical protein
MKLKLQQSHFVVKKWMNRTYRHYFDEWTDMWEFQRKCRKAINKMANRGLSQAGRTQVGIQYSTHSLKAPGDPTLEAIL